ncbi:MAG: helix-turn-helix domain-containing protein [Planctomycetota bacterium]
MPDDSDFHASTSPDARQIVQSILGCKWSFAILEAVREGIRRPGALERHCQGISPKVLQERLRKLTRLGVLERHAFPEIPPRVEYHFTDKGHRFGDLLDMIDRLEEELRAESDSA